MRTGRIFICQCISRTMPAHSTKKIAVKCENERTDVFKIVAKVLFVL